MIEEAKALPNCKKVLQGDGAVFANEIVENLAPIIAKLSANYSHVLAPASTFGKSIMPAAAALADKQQISEIVAVNSANEFVRPIYAGNALATVQSEESSIFLTIRSTAFELTSKTGGSGMVEAIEAPADSGLVAIC